MPPSPIPAPLPPWARAALQIAPYVGGWLYDALTYHNPAPTVMQWRHLQIRCKNTATGSVVQDDAVIGFDLVNITGGNVDNSWTTSDYTTCEALFDTWLTAVKVYTASYGTYSEYRWYTHQFNDPDTSPAIMDAGPPARVTAKAVVGTGGTSAAPQVSMSVTEKTAWPRHWGRFYMPFSSVAMGTGMRFSTAAIDAVANATSTLYSGLATAEFFPVVPVTQIDRSPARALITVNQIQVDDVPDVVRRRRPRNTTYRKILP